MKKMYKTLVMLMIALIVSSCSYLDVVPDNVATFEMAFNNRASAERYLGTCYHHLPRVFDVDYNAALTAGDDISWFLRRSMFWDASSSWELARGFQNSNEPYYNYWSGGLNLFRGIHECNIFIDNIDRVPDMSTFERDRWKAEVLTLKAYYLFWLFKHYGPIPLLRENLEISASLDEMRAPREKVDVVVDYIVELLDEAINMPYALPGNITASYTEAGRISKASALAIKAKVLVFAASPLFNGNTDYVNFLDPTDGEPFFNQDNSQGTIKQKWQRAAIACGEAIDFAEVNNYSLYQFEDRVPFALNDTSRLLMTLTNNIPSRFNEEELFGPGQQGSTSIQRFSQARLTAYMVGINLDYAMSQHAPTLNIVEKFYSKNGVPINEDNSSLDFSKTIVNTPEDNPYYYAPDYQSINFHYNREPRFYASIGFDGGKWFTSERETFEEAFNLKTRKGEIAGMSADLSSATGYFAKKLVSYKNQNNQQQLTIYPYSVPIIRLADLYLMYAEALNEVKDVPDDEVYTQIQKVRHRAGLDVNTTLTNTWAQYSRQPNKPSSKEGMREIIHQERDIELAFEGKRYDDLRRWKRAVAEMDNVPIRGWTIREALPEAFYREKILYVKRFTPRDYLWPLKQNDLNVNPKLVQNPLW